MRTFNSGIPGSLITVVVGIPGSLITVVVLITVVFAYDCTTGRIISQRPRKTRFDRFDTFLALSNSNDRSVRGIGFVSFDWRKKGIAHCFSPRCIFGPRQPVLLLSPSQRKSRFVPLLPTHCRQGSFPRVLCLRLNTDWEYFHTKD